MAFVVSDGDIRWLKNILFNTFHALNTIINYYNAKVFQLKRNKYIRKSTNK